MEFAKQELAKYGWKEGKGLGREEKGILNPVRPQLKFDKAGMGHDAAETFTNHWWEKAFNAAADNITVNKYVDGSVTVDAENAYDIDDHKGMSKKRKHLVFNNFIKTATLTNEGAMAEEPRIAEEIPLVITVPVLTDEELFRACGGRTAHKGARHGLGLNGKLARIEQQERLLLNVAEKVFENVQTSKRKKSKKSQVSNDAGVQKIESQENVIRNMDQTIDVCSEMNNGNSQHVKKVKKSKKSKKDDRIEEITPNGEQLENNLKPKGTGHKKSKISVEESENLNEICLNGGEINSKRSKKIRREKNKLSIDIAEESIEEKKDRRRRERKSKKANDAIVEEEVEIEKPRKKSNKPIISDCEEATTESASPVMDKKEKRKKRMCVADDVMESTADDTEKVDEVIPLKKKKKKSRRKEMAE